MQYQFILDRSFYQYQSSIIEWCRTYVGEGDWSQLINDTSALWAIKCTFGQMILSFKNLKDANLFAETWCIIEDY